MKIRLTLLLFLFINIYCGLSSAQAEPNRIEAYVRAGCVHCERAKEFLTALKAEEPDLEIEYYEVTEDRAAAERFLKLMEEFSVERAAVPAFLINGKLIIGFNNAQTTGEQIRRLALGRSGAQTLQSSVDIPVFGEISVEAYGLVIFTIVIGLIDGFNPCAMWVLLFLLSMLVNVNDRKKMALIAGIFVLVSGVVYFAFMAAWLNFFFLAGMTRTIQVILAFAALAAAAINIKDFFAFGKWASLSVPDSFKSRIGRIIRGIVMAENLPAALASVCVLAALVNFVELMCTAGLPALYTQILISHKMTWLKYYSYLALYNAAYIFDDSVMVFTAVFGLARLRVQESAGRVLKLISGCVMVIIAVLLLFKPQWLSFF